MEAHLTHTSDDDATRWTLLDVADMFPTDAAATEWLEQGRWPDGRECPRCAATDTTETPRRRPQPYWCRQCRHYFSWRTNTTAAHSKVPARKWIAAIMLLLTRPKGIAAAQLAKDLGINRNTAWSLAMRIRRAWTQPLRQFTGPVEADETYLGGLEANKHANKKLRAGRGPVGKTPIAGLYDRHSGRIHLQAVPATDTATLCAYVETHTTPTTTVYTDDHGAYKRLHRPHGSVNHTHRQYVDGPIHTNSIESIWAILKRAHKGTWHHLTDRHLPAYLNEIAHRHNTRHQPTGTRITNTIRAL